MLIEVLRTCFWDCEALQKQLEKDQQILSEQMQRLEEQRQEQVRENNRRMFGSLLGVILCVIAVAILNSNSGDNDRSSKRPVYTFRPPVAQKYDDPAIRMAMELLKDQDRDQNLTPLEKKQKEIEAKQEELRKATASGANHAKLLQLTYELQTLRAEYEALEMAEEEKDETSKKPDRRIGLFDVKDQSSKWRSSRNFSSGCTGQSAASALSVKRIHLGSSASSLGHSGSVSPWLPSPLGSPVRIKLAQ